MEQHWPVVPQQHSQCTEGEYTEAAGNHSSSHIDNTNRNTVGLWCHTAAYEPGKQ